MHSFHFLFLGPTIISLGTEVTDESVGNPTLPC